MQIARETGTKGIVLVTLAVSVGVLYLLYRTGETNVFIPWLFIIYLCTIFSIGVITANPFAPATQIPFLLGLIFWALYRYFLVSRNLFAIVIILVGIVEIYRTAKEYG